MKYTWSRIPGTLRDSVRVKYTWSRISGAAQNFCKCAKHLVKNFWTSPNILFE
jgi:hypothetical protein